MSILIKGMKMPKGADEHRLIIRANGQVIIDKKTYWEEAEAVPVPPHGRLIDADDADEYAYDILEISESYRTPYEAARAMQKIYLDAPTILEADEG